MHQIQFSNRALADLDELWLYVARDNVGAADSLFESIQDRIGLLASQPPIGEACPETGPNLRRSPIGNYVIYYKVVADFLQISRIVHGSRDIKSIFP